MDVIRGTCFYRAARDIPIIHSRGPGGVVLDSIAIVCAGTPARCDGSIGAQERWVGLRRGGLQRGGTFCLAGVRCHCIRMVTVPVLPLDLVVEIIFNQTTVCILAVKGRKDAIRQLPQP